MISIVQSARRTAVIAVFLAASGLAAQTSESDYFGLIPPGDTAEIFGPLTISVPGRGEHGATFSPDGREFYFSATSDWVNLVTYVRKLEGNDWSDERKAAFSLHNNAAEPAFDPDGNSLVFTDGCDLWAVMRQGGDWEPAERLATEVNSPPFQWHPALARNGNLYFSYRGDIYKSVMENGRYRKAVLLSEPVNSSAWDADAVIAPDESWIIFNSNRSGGFGDADIYISYAKDNGGWTQPANPGTKINTAMMDDPASITPDGRFLLFSRRSGSESDIYWVSAEFIERLKPKDAVP